MIELNQLTKVYSEDVVAVEHTSIKRKRSIFIGNGYAPSAYRRDSRLEIILDRPTTGWC